MRKVVILVIVLLVIGVGVLSYKTPYSPCTTPQTYKIGSIDSKFKLTESEVIADTNSAVGILNKAYGKNLFEYSESNGKITVNFVYDQRTRLDQEIQTQLGEVDKGDAELEAKLKQYSADVAAFENKLRVFNAKVQKYNNEGGAPPEIYNSLVEEQNNLKSEANFLETKARNLDLETSNFNTRVNNLNQDVTEFNDALSVKPEEGVYDSETDTITVYFVDNKPELIHTLAHEFGHALGMEHVEDEKAIMFPLSTKGLTFTNEDRSELDRVCGSYPLLAHWADMLYLKYYDFASNLIMTSNTQ